MLSRRAAHGRDIYDEEDQSGIVRHVHLPLFVNHVTQDVAPKRKPICEQQR